MCIECRLQAPVSMFKYIQLMLLTVLKAFLADDGHILCLLYSLVLMPDDFDFWCNLIFYFTCLCRVAIQARKAGKRYCFLKFWLEKLDMLFPLMRNSSALFQGCHILLQLLKSPQDQKFSSKFFRDFFKKLIIVKTFS